MTQLAAEHAVNVLDSFEDPAIDPRTWERLLASGPSDVVFLSLPWQREWWRAFGGEKLLIVVAERDGEPRAIAPMFSMAGMLYLVGSGGSDYLDFIGDVDGLTLAAMLDAARREVPDFVGISLFHVPALSRTTSLLPNVAAHLGLELCKEGEMCAPYLDLTDNERVTQLVERRRLRRDDERMLREGPLEIRTATDVDLDPWLDCFFAQHDARWRPGAGEGLDRTFCRAIVHAGHREGWLRFTMLEWRGRPAAFDISLLHGGRSLTYLVSRDVSITRHSPGKILEGHTLSVALRAGARTLDFGLGDEAYKLAHASGVARVANWALWPQ